MRSKWMVLAGINGLLAVAAGAFGAHALKKTLAPEALTTFEVGARYQMYHALALLAVAVIAEARPSRTIAAAGSCFLFGIVLFSGSLYGLSLAGWNWLGPVTPIGGVLFMLGWALLVWSGWPNSETRRGLED